MKSDVLGLCITGGTIYLSVYFFSQMDLSLVMDDRSFVQVW